MHKSELQELQHEFYARALAELGRFQDLLTAAERGRLSHRELDLFNDTIGKLSLEAKALEVSAVFRLRLENLSMGPARAPLTEAMQMLNRFLESKGRHGKRSGSADK